MYACRDYLNFSDCQNICPSDRMKLVDWCYDIVDTCLLSRETVAVAMNLVDRFMSTRVCNKSQFCRSELQLVAVTALYISIKINERIPFSSQDFATMSQGTYSLEEIESMEIELLQAVEWRLNAPTALQIGFQIISLLPLHQELEKTFEAAQTRLILQEELAFQTELAVREYRLTMQRASTVALAAIMNAIDRVVYVNDDYAYLMDLLPCIWKEQAFEELPILFMVKNQLQGLLDENEEQDKTEESLITVEANTSTNELNRDHSAERMFDLRSLT